MSERPLWRSLHRRPQEHAPAPGVEEHLASLVVALIAAAIAVAAIVVGSVLGNVRPSSALASHQRVQEEAFAWASAAILVVSGIMATRRIATLLGHAVAARTIRGAGLVVRMLTAFVGYVFVLFSALGLLDVSLTHIITAGAFTGVVLGIAAQQSLGNVFAGMVLLLARPFGIGDHIRVRSGALGGIFDGVVLGMSLTYVTISTEDGLLKIPNSGLLAAAVGPFRAKPVVAPVPGPGPVTGQVPITGSTVVIPEPGTDTRPPVVAPVGQGAGAGTGQGELGEPQEPAAEEPPRPNPWRQLAARGDRQARPPEGDGG